MCKRIKFAYQLVHSNYEKKVDTGQRPLIKAVEQTSFISLFDFKKKSKFRIYARFYVCVISAYAYMQSKKKLNGMDAILNESIFGKINIH